MHALANLDLYLPVPVIDILQSAIVGVVPSEALLSKKGLIIAGERRPISREPITRAKGGISIAVSPIPPTPYTSTIEPLRTISDRSRPFACDRPHIRVCKRLEGWEECASELEADLVLISIEDSGDGTDTH